jgi:hypothetical protein
MFGDSPTACPVGQTTYPVDQTACPWNRGPKPCFGYTWMCSCNGDKAFNVNTLFGDPAWENLWLDPNRNTLPHDHFKISDKSGVMASFDDVPEEARKAFEECYTKDQCGSITQIKELIFPLIGSIKEVHTAQVSHPSTSVTPEDVSAMFSKNVKFTRNMAGEEIAKGLAKFSQISKY